MPLLAIITKNFHQSFIIKKTCRAGSPDPPYTRSLNIWPTLKNTEDAASRTSGAALATGMAVEMADHGKVVHIVADDEHFLGFAPAPQLEQVSHARGLLTSGAVMSIQILLKCTPAFSPQPSIKASDHAADSPGSA